MALGTLNAYLTCLWFVNRIIPSYDLRLRAKGKAFLNRKNLGQVKYLSPIDRFGSEAGCGFDPAAVTTDGELIVVENETR